MGRKPCCEKEGMNRGAWTAMEDKLLTDYISINGEGKWRSLPTYAGLKRCGKSCRLRWLNYLRPDIKRGNITSDEEDLIVRLHTLLGNRWSLIAGRLPGRTDNEIKNYWNTSIGKRLANVSKQNDPLPSMSSLPRHQNLSPPTLTCAIRPKATRCTKVVISKELQNTQQNNNVETTFNNNGYAGIQLKNPQDVVHHGTMCPIDESKTFDMQMDTKIDLDNHVLSQHNLELLSSFKLQEKQTEYMLMSSPLMNSPFLENNADGEIDLDWIASFLQTELNDEETSHMI